MRLAGLTLAALALSAAPAAARGWTPPEPVSQYASLGESALSQDGTIVSAARTHHGIEVRLGRTSRFFDGIDGVAVAAGGVRELAAAWDDGSEVRAITSGAGTATTIGTGRLVDLVANRDGTMALLVNQEDRLALAYRAPGDEFGALIPLPGLEGGQAAALAIDPVGAVTVVSADEEVRVLTRSAAGALSAVTVLSPASAAEPYLILTALRPYAEPRIVVDARGRAAAFWGRRTGGPPTGYTHESSVRGQDGSWSVPTALGGLTHYDVAASDAGELVIAYSKCCPGPVEVITGSIESGEFAAPVETGLAGSYPRVAMRADGAALVFSSTNRLTDAVRRSAATAPFGPPENVVCGSSPGPAGFDAGGNAVLGHVAYTGAWSITRESATEPPGDSGECPLALARPLHAVIAPTPPREGRPARISVNPGLGFRTQLDSVEWDFDDEPGYELRTSSPVVRHAFTTVGSWQEFPVRLSTSEPDGTRVEHVTALRVDVLPRMRLALARRPVKAGVLRVRLSTPTAAYVGRRVWLGAYTGKERFSGRALVPALAARPRTVRIPLGPGARRRLRRAARKDRRVPVVIEVSSSEADGPPPVYRAPLLKRLRGHLLT